MILYYHMADEHFADFIHKGIMGNYNNGAAAAV